MSRRGYGRCAIIIAVSCILTGCGAARAVSTTGKAFDNFGCLARDFKGEPPCVPEKK